MILRRLRDFFLDVLEVIVFAIAIFLFVYLLVLQPHKIKGSSMHPNFPDGEYLLTDKITYRLRQPQRGEVIVFEAPYTQGDEFIKRIIGLPGENVSLNDNKIYINGKGLQESYLSSEIQIPGGSFLKNGETVKVPEENYFVLGDNRPGSSDSRSWGFVTKDKITGRAWIIYWPPPKLGLVEEINYNIDYN